MNETLAVVVIGVCAAVVAIMVIFAICAAVIVALAESEDDD